jgi:mannosyltransferase
MGREVKCPVVSVLTLSERRRHARVGSNPAALTEPAGLAVIALTVLAAVLRLYRIGHQGYWFDEANTVLLIHLSPGKMLGLIPQTESTPPLYYCIAWIWARIFGFGEAGMRSLSAVIGTLVVPVMYLLGSRLVSRRAGVIAAALTACNPYLVWYSQEARSYELMVLTGAVSLLAFLYARENPSPRAVTGWVIASALALTTHYYAVLVVVPCAVLLLVAHWRERTVHIGIAAVALCGLALLPLAISQNQTGHASWISPIPLGPRLGQIIPQFLVGYGAPGLTALERICEALALAALVLLALRSDAVERRGALLAGGLAVVGIVINLILVGGGIDDLITRNVIILWVPAAVCIAGGLAAERARLVGALVALSLCGIGVFAVGAVAFDRNLQRPDWRGVARVLGSTPTAPGGRVILVQHYKTLLPLSLYMPGLKFWRSRHPKPVTTTEFDIISIAAPRVALCWYGAACNLTPSTMQASYPLRGFREVWVRHIYQFTVMRLVAARPTRLTQPEISAILTTTSLRHDELLLQH